MISGSLCCGQVLGIGHALDKSIHAAQEGLVKKFEVLDRRDAASQRQLMTFNVLLRCAALVLGVFLMLMELPPGEQAWHIRQARTCFAGGGQKEYYEDDTPKRRLELGTLFSFVVAIGEVQSLCLELIKCIRKYQVRERCHVQLDIGHGTPPM